AVPAGLADAQAERDAPGPGGIAAGGSGRRLECSPGEAPASLALAMAANPLADPARELDAAAAQDDAQGEPLPPGTGLGNGRGSRPPGLGPDGSVVGREC